jgi:hypothetical protein
MVALGHSEDRKDLEDTYLHSKKWIYEFFVNIFKKGVKILEIYFFISYIVIYT